MAELFAAAVQDAMKEEWSWLKESISILDFGCGFGMNAVALAQGGHTMTAVDISKPMIESTRLESWKKQVHNDVHVLHTPVGDGSEIPPGEYEMVLIAFVLYHVDIERRRVIIQNVTETVKTGARICIVDFDNTKRSQDARKRIYHTDHPGKKEEGPWNSEWLEKSDMSALLEASNLKVETPKTFAVRHEKDDFVIMDCYYIIATVK
jgi:SAM-dependent methyltransferase